MKVPKRIAEIIDDIEDQYLEEDRYNRPWIIGFSGAKTQLSFLCLHGSLCKKLERKGMN